MAEQINLATFGWDTDKLYDSLIDLKNQMTILKNEQTVIAKGAKDLAKEFSATTASMAKLANEGGEATDEYKELEAQQKKLYDAMSVQNTLLETTSSNLKIVTKEYQTTSNILNSITNDENEFSNAVARTNEMLERQNTSIASARASNKEILALRNQLNPALAEEADLIQQLNARLDENNAFIKENASAYEQQKINIGNYSESIKDAFQDLNIFNGGLGGFIGRAEEAGGVGNLATNSFKQMSTAIVGMTKSALAFIATPIGATIAVIAGIAVATKAIWDYNSGLKEAIKLTETFTGLSGVQADAVRQQAQALSETFGNDFQENLKVAQKLVETFGITYEQAFEEIERGLVRGGTANKEFFDSLNEYPVFFAKAGFSAQEFIDIIDAGFDLGIYNDKLPDALKEADISLREQTKATREALVNAFGASFTDDILKRIRTGQTTVKDALNEISTEAEIAQLTQQQYAQLTADIFRGAGEDVGGAVKVFEALRVANENANRPLTETEKHLKDLTDANMELQVAMDDALKSDSVISLQKNLELFWVKAQTIFFQLTKSVREAYEWFWEISDRSESLQSIWANLQKIGSALNKAFETIQTSLGRIAEKFGLGMDEGKGFMSVILSIFDPIKRLENGLNLVTDALVWIVEQFEDATIRAEAFGRTIGQTFSQIKNLDFNSLLDFKETVDKNAEAIRKENEAFIAKQEMVKSIQALLEVQQGMQIEKGNEILEVTDKQAKSEKDLEAERQKAYQAQLQRMNEELDLFIEQQGDRARTLKEELELERLIAKDSIKILDFQLKNKQISRTKYATEVLKIENDLARRTAELAVENAGREIEEWRKKNESKLELDTFFNEQDLALEQKRLDDLKQKEIEFAEFQKAQGIINANELNDIKLQIDEDYLLKRDELYKSYEVQRKERELLQASLDFEEKILKLQEDSATEFEIQQEIRNEQRAQEIEAMEQEAIQKNYTHEMYKQAENNINRKYDLLDKEAKEQKEKAVFDTQLQYAQMSLSAMGEVIGKETAAGKALAVAQIGISTAMAIMKSYADLGPIAGTIFAAIVGTVSAFQVKKVLTTKEPKVDTTIRGFADGGIIDDGHPIRRANGDDVLITAKRGEVILNERHQRMLGGNATFASIGVPGFATSGIVGNLPSESAIVQNNVYNQMNEVQLSETIANAVMEGARLGSQEGSQIGTNNGLVDASANREVQRNATF